MSFRTRFAPSPTGPLHLGHAFSAMLAHHAARDAGGAFLLRIEDLDQDRCRPAWEAQIIDDLRWLGLTWDGPVRRQSEHIPLYENALETLIHQGLVFPCSCSRADIRAAMSAPQQGYANIGPDGPAYPGTCRHRPMADRQPGDALRLNMRRAVQQLGAAPLVFVETGAGKRGQQIAAPDWLTDRVGDIVLGRRGNGQVAYHLAVVVDDAAQTISHVIRGEDLFEATAIHVLLQRLLGLPTPVYHHHRLIRDDAGKRLAKRDDARAIARYRADGLSPDDIARMVTFQSIGAISSCSSPSTTAV